MRFYYYDNKSLYDLLRFKKIDIDYDFTERFDVTLQILKEITEGDNFVITDPKLRAIALTFLYKYVYENVSGLVHILKSRNEFNKKTLVLRKGNSKLYKISSVKDINLASKDGYLYNRILFLAYYRLGIKKSTQYKFQNVIALIKRDNLSTRIWNLIASKIDIENEIRDEDFFGFVLKDWFTKDPVIKNALAELKIFKKVLGNAFFLKTKYYLISGSRYFALNPTNNFVTFEQHTISYMTLSFLSEKLNIASISIAHAVINADYKRHMAFDHCLLYGKSSEESLTREDSIVCGKLYKTGAPVMNRMFINILPSADFAHKVLYLTDYITGYGYDIEEVHVAKNTLVKSLLKKFPEISLTVKYHPAKINPYVQSILSDCKNVTFKQNVDIHTEIDNADVVICDGWSSSGLEIAIRKRPLIVLNVKQRRKDYYKYYETGYASNVTDENSMYKAYGLIKEAKGKINEQARKELIEYHLEYEDGITHTANTLEKLIAA